MKINDALILKLENLSRLELNQDEKSLIKGDLEKILNMVEKLQDLDTENVEPLKHVTTSFKSPRIDNARSIDIRKEALELSPKKVDDFFAIPKIIDKS